MLTDDWGDFLNREKATKLAHEIIGMVEHDIRTAHPEVDRIATELEIDGEKPNTLLHGETYYQLEDAIAEKLLHLK